MTSPDPRRGNAARLSLLPLLTLLALLAPSAAGQASPGDVEVRLEALDSIVKVGGEVRLRLTIDVKRPTAIPATLLRGLDLRVEVGDQPGSDISERADGEVALVGDTRIERVLKLDTARLAPAADPDAVTRLAIAWSGAPGATATVELTPDVGADDLDRLDLSRTRVVLDTDQGRLTVRLFADKAPITARNFVKLAATGFYDRTKFHRIISGFMVQGGCPNTKPGANGAPGTGNPGYTIPGEVNDTRHVRGVLSMAHSGSPDSAGSQFFVCHGEANWLDGKYTAFGELTEDSLPVLDLIASTPVRANARGERSVPLEDRIVHRAIVLPVYEDR